ncbi:Rv3654c family TadE-like protein [Nesterenkonia muleiensis]|uniref:Rv3654c family TadE-like protein n=1 Tax=Nesterenkonia muleiensis TaxID=2282648 RepID=UPI000E734540|nr:Rv3654c family TadE-like protein [Nesterenkonia muleiensis]
MKPHHPQDERGSGTVVAVGIIAVLIVLLALVALLGAAAAAKTQAARAADLAALAAADTARGMNTGDPCTVAEEVAARNNAVLQKCSVGGDYPTEVTVTVSRDSDVVVISHILPAMALAATGTSRAGPPEALPDD